MFKSLVVLNSNFHWIYALQLPLLFVHMCLFKPGVFPADSQREPPSINLAARNISGPEP
jgi:hypothetical protein